MANSYLTHTTSAPTNDKIMTFSFWLKKGKEQEPIMSRHIDGNNRFQFYNLDSSAGLQLYQQVSGSVEMNLSHDRQLRDFSAWYHQVIAIDTTQATASDRVKIYINGELLSGYSTATYPAQNADILFNGTSVVQEIGRTNGSDYYNGYMSHFAFVDGTALTPTSFGETDSTSGIWKFKTPSGVTWGNNGFHLKFENSGALGTDSSGQGNNFTVNGNLKQALDTPSNVYSVINQLTYSASQVTIQNGALSKAGTPTSNAWRSFYGTLGASSGKYYFEMKVDQIENSDPNNFWVGIVDIEQMTHTANNQQFYKQGRGYGYHAQSGSTGNNNQTFSYGNSWTAGDIIGVAMDLDNAKMYFSKNGTWQNSGVPTSCSTGTGAFIIAANITYVPAFSQYYANEQFSLNFGNGFFGTTAITSAGSNGNGSLFEYDVPSGYYALNTKNINTYG